MRIKYNLRAFEQLRRDPAVVRLLGRSAEAIADACGEGYVADTGQGKTRARGSVITATAEAQADNAANQTLARNLDRGRL